MIDVLKIDKDFQKTIAAYPNNQDILLRYNEFRIANASILPKTRPQILIGGPIGIEYPNLHSSPLFEVADVVCLTASQNPFPLASAIFCRPSTFFFDILKRLPPGFNPDFYWDNQVEHNHFIPAGIELAPFPTVASVSHTYLHKSIEHICELFDLVIPVSKFYGTILEKKYPKKIINLPFGLNWASFDHLLTPTFNKSIDVSLIFGDDNPSIYCHHRTRVIDLFKKFKEKYKDRFLIEITSKLSNASYIELLKKSRITINVTGINGPYNYRTIEAICSGSMVFQYKWEHDFFENDFSELFVEETHGVTFNYENFESKLLYYLENKELVKKIAKEAYEFLTENFQYKTLYQKLIQSVKEAAVTLPRLNKTSTGLHNLDMAYYNQPGNMIEYMNYGVINSLSQTSWIKYNNLMILACTYKDTSLGYPILITSSAEVLKSIEKADVFELCKKYHDLALQTVPEKYIWLIEWNYLLISIEKGEATKEDIAKILILLEADPATPFDENQLIFKYYVNLPLYPQYQLNKSFDKFYELNMELIKVIDNPIKRALIYKNYAVEAAKYFLEILSKDIIVAKI